MDTLTEENSQLVQDKEELTRLRELYDLDQQYTDYEKVGARVIAKESGNWFQLFTIDKGSNDGIQKDANVISGGGLVGIVAEVGPNWQSSGRLLMTTAMSARWYQRPPTSVSLPGTFG